MSKHDETVDGIIDESKDSLSLKIGLTFSTMMDRAKEAVFDVYDQTTIQTLLDHENDPQ